MSIENPVALAGAPPSHHRHPKWVIRRKYVENQLLPQIKNHFENTEIFSAVTEDHFSTNWTDRTLAFNGKNFKLGDNGIPGNFLSHYVLWEYCAAADVTLLVLEDDALLPPANETAVCETINKYGQMPDDATILYLQSQIPWHETALHTYSQLRNLDDGFVGLTVCADLSGTAAYAIKPAAAKKLMPRALERGTSPTDSFLHTAFNDGVIGVMLPKNYQQGFMLNEHFAAWNH